jgi:hypothetical protein
LSDDWNNFDPDPNTIIPNLAQINQTQLYLVNGHYVFDMEVGTPYQNVNISIDTVNPWTSIIDLDCSSCSTPNDYRYNPSNSSSKNK